MLIHFVLIYLSRLSLSDYNLTYVKKKHIFLILPSPILNIKSSDIGIKIDTHDALVARRYEQ